MERAENLSRILHVHSTFSRSSGSAQNWSAVLGLNDDEERFTREHCEATAESVMRFYLLDRTNETSIVSAVEAARTNARALRSLLSSEAWAQLNVMRNWVNSLDETALDVSGLTRLLSRIKNSCQEHTGIMEGTYYRDHGWRFYWLGRYIERADQTTRLLDIKYHLLLPDIGYVGSSLDLDQWSSLLRSTAGYHAFRRMGRGETTPKGVAEFLLLDPRFPRSVSLCLTEIQQLLLALCEGDGSDDELASEDLFKLNQDLSSLSIDEILVSGLHEFIERIQRRLITVSSDLSARYFHGA